jgi:hypothetical protein
VCLLVAVVAVHTSVFCVCQVVVQQHAFGGYLLSDLQGLVFGSTTALHDTEACVKAEFAQHAVNAAATLSCLACVLSVSHHVQSMSCFVVGQLPYALV